MLKGYEILDKIPAYDLKDICRNADFYGKGINETLEDYKNRTVANRTREEIVNTIVDMINDWDIESEALLVLKAILKDKKLLDKTKIVYDGSFRNMRIWTMRDYDEYGNDVKSYNLDISWHNVVKSKLGIVSKWDVYNNNFIDSIEEKDIIEVLNNLEEIFIQPQGRFYLKLTNKLNKKCIWRN